MHRNTTTWVLPAVTAIAALAFSSASAQAQPKPKPACGLKAFPLIEGTEWVYQATAIPDRPPPKQPLPKPKQPDTVTIKVMSVKPLDNKITEITLEESVGYRTYQTVLTCQRDSLIVPPESLFFTGEPGGGLGIELGEIEREGNSYVFLRGLVQVPEWVENLKAPFTRTAAEGTTAKMANGTLDLQRVVLIGLPEQITTPAGTFSAAPVQIDLRGGVTIDLEPEPYQLNIPANTLSKLWFAENIGVVQIFSFNQHLYQLSEIKSPGDEPAPAQ